jgi:hypothetical protein
VAVVELEKTRIKRKAAVVEVQVDFVQLSLQQDGVVL